MVCTFPQLLKTDIHGHKRTRCRLLPLEIDEDVGKAGVKETKVDYLQIKLLTFKCNVQTYPEEVNDRNISKDPGNQPSLVYFCARSQK